MIMLTVATSLHYSCRQSSEPNPDESAKRGEPVIVTDTLVFDEGSKTFSLTLHADSTAGAVVTFYLLDGDSLIMQSSDGVFNDIKPLEEGYKARIKVEWSDTTIITPAVSVCGFVIPREPVEKLSKEELQRIINAAEKDVLDEHLAQNVRLTVYDCAEKPSLLHEVFVYLENKVWESVSVDGVTYDDNNLITSLTLKAIVSDTTSNLDDEFEFSDEF